ncbi:hypothetical protein SAMN02746041_01300 [Desulfacinum hydrothermale DSM 13146]|uniref:Uncharacterized protein n=1 Tax=Desulfacinum hydrothermale DSM 13146 TaxID=1121390 RepID=A0A1W1XCV8_9BACT|nr:hypothetical protein [Desulfacinum hydrothermale]SMC21875.1 hypothetical protein SAMN02746041_01300 [Desulfacinum hydrothermale DSM 13146]
MTEKGEKSPKLPAPPSPQPLRDRLTGLQWEAKALADKRQQLEAELREVEAFLEIQPRVAERLEMLSSALFGDILDEVERNLTYALQDILGQELRVVTSRQVQRGKVQIRFGIERGGHPEDILRGQGGSVCNVLSVGLRFIALSQLDEREHRRFLVLDEQDCWLRPDLVPRLMGIVHTIAHKLGFQVLVISHHSVDLFREHADRIFVLRPSPDPHRGVRVEQQRDRDGESPADPMV